MWFDSRTVSNYKKLSDAQSAHYLPPYKKLQKEKKKTYFDKMVLSENSVFGALESWMTKTFDRIKENLSFRPIIEKLAENYNGLDAEKCIRNYLQ